MELIRVLWPELAAPLADGFLAHHDPTCKEQRFDVARTQAEVEGQPAPMADGLGGEAVFLVAVDR
jgi:hypothetical protein